MLIETHAKIALKIADELRIKERRNVDLLVQGSRLPDDWGNFPHHRGKDGDIVTYILSARELYLKRDDECYVNLGIALHYIADKWTLAPRTGDKHTSYERAIATLPILSDIEFERKLETIAMPAKSAKAYKELLEKLRSNKVGETEATTRVLEETGSKVVVRVPQRNIINLAMCERPTSYSSAIIDLNFAYRIALKISERILEPLTPMQQKLLQRIKQLEKKTNSFPWLYLKSTWVLDKVIDQLEYTHAWRDWKKFQFNKWSYFKENAHIEVHTSKEQIPQQITEEREEGWLFRKKVKTEKIVYSTKETKSYRINLFSQPSMSHWRYISCPSENVMKYVFYALTAPEGSNDMLSRLRDLPIPRDVEKLGTIVNRYEKDKRKISRLNDQAESQGLFRGFVELK